MDPDRQRPSKMAVVGAGSVGATIAYACLIRGAAKTVALYDARVVEAVPHDEGRVLPVSSLLDGQYGIAEVCLSLPTVVDRGGVRSVLTPPLTAGETAALRRSADAVRSVARSLGL